MQMDDNTTQCLCLSDEHHDDSNQKVSILSLLRPKGMTGCLQGTLLQSSNDIFQCHF